MAKKLAKYSPELRAEAIEAGYVLHQARRSEALVYLAAGVAGVRDIGPDTRQQDPKAADVGVKVEADIRGLRPGHAARVVARTENSYANAQDTSAGCSAYISAMASASSPASCCSPITSVLTPLTDGLPNRMSGCTRTGDSGLASGL